MSSEFPSILSPGNGRYRPVWKFPKSLHSQGLFLFNLTQSSVCPEYPFPGVFVHKDQQQMFNIAAVQGGENIWSKEEAGKKKKYIKGKAGE